MKKTLLFAFFWSIILSTMQQVTAVIFSWRTLPLLEMPLITLVFMIVLGVNFRLIIITSCLTGFFLDLWSGSNFGAIMASLTFTILISFKIFQYLLTNKSILALLILGTLATILFRLLIFLINLADFLKTPELIYITLAEMSIRSIIQIAFHSIVLLLFFLITRILSKHFHHHYLRMS